MILKRKKKTTEQDNVHATDRLKRRIKKKAKDYFVLTAFPHIVIDFNRGRHISKKEKNFFFSIK